MKEGWAEALDVRAEDMLIWRLRRAAPPPTDIACSIAGLARDSNWDYLAGEALRFRVEPELLAALRSDRRTPSADGGDVWDRRDTGAQPAQPPPDLADRLEREMAAGRRGLSPWSLEGRLLVLCGSPRMTAEEESQVARLASGSLRWEALVLSAARCALTVTVQRNLSRLELDERMPAGLAEMLARRARGVSGRNVRVVRILNEVTQVLHGAGVRPVLLKETALALSHFGNGRLRSIEELELLLAGGAEEAVRVVEACGWRREASDDDGDLLCLADQAISLRLRRRLSLPIREPTDLTAKVETRSLRIDASRRCVCPTDMILHLCLDLLDGALSGRLARLCDAREVVRQGGVEWPLLEERARAFKVEPQMAFALRLLASVETSVPAGLIGRLELAGDSRLDERGLQHAVERNLLGCDERGGARARARSLRRFQAMAWPGTDGPGLLDRVLRIPAHASRALARWTGPRRMP